MPYFFKVVALALACLFLLSKRTFAEPLDPAKAAIFWYWVEENEARLTHTANTIAMFDEIDEALKQVHPSLVFEFGERQGGKTPFVISADGILEYFPAVEELVGAAPQFENLRIVAFRPPLQDFSGKVLSLNDREMKADDLRFQEFTDQGGFDLVLVHSLFGSVDRDHAIGLAFLMLDSALGEYDVATQVGYIDFVSPEELEAIDFEFELRDFSELPNVFTDFKIDR